MLFIILHIVDRLLHYYTPNRPFSRYLVNITQAKNSVTDSLFKANGFIIQVVVASGKSSGYTQIENLRKRRFACIY